MTAFGPSSGRSFDVSRGESGRRLLGESGRSGLALFVRSDLGYYTFMAPKHGPFRERFEAYILERTANHRPQLET